MVGQQYPHRSAKEYEASPPPSSAGFCTAWTHFNRAWSVMIEGGIAGDLNHALNQ
jgi:hypothetical protein